MKTILVTGATSGVGLALTKKLLAQGHQVHATGRNEASLKTLQHLGAQAYRVDLSERAAIQQLCEQLPPIDVAILSAGVGKFENVVELSDASIENMVFTNVTMPILLAKRLATRMIANGSGHIILLGSQAGKVATPKASVYAATKHAIVGLANGLRMELAAHHVFVTAIHPGPIDTPFLDLADDSKTYRKAVAKVLLQPDFVADEIIKVVHKPVREVNLPRIMGITSKLYQLMPSVIEKLGKSFFYKK